MAPSGNPDNRGTILFMLHDSETGGSPYITFNSHHAEFVRIVSAVARHAPQGFAVRRLADGNYSFYYARTGKKRNRLQVRQAFNAFWRQHLESNFSVREAK